MNRRFLLALALVLALAAPALGEGVMLDFTDVEVADLAKVISEVSGRNIVLDAGVKARISLVSPRSIPVSQALEAFQSALEAAGYTMLRSGAVDKIVARGPGLGGVDGVGLVTRVFPLSRLEATHMASSVLPTLLGKNAIVAAHPDSNMVVVTDSAAALERLAGLLDEMERAAAPEITVLPLKHLSSAVAASLINDALGSAETAGQPVRRGSAPASAGRVLAYERAAAVVVLGREGFVQSVKSLLTALDLPSADSGHPAVHYLENADAEKLAAVLNAAVAARRSGERGSNQTAVVADKATNALVVNASAEDAEFVRGLITQLDIARRQVFVEALVLELSTDLTEKVGVSWQGAGAVDSGLAFGSSNLNANSVGLADMATNGSGVPGLLSRALSGIVAGGLFHPVTVDGPGGSPITVPALSVILELARTNSEINVMSAPRLLTAANEEAEIVVGSNVPIITGRLTGATGNADALSQSVSVERRDVALTLKIRPQITEGDLVRLDVHQEITELASINSTVGDINEVGPTFTKRLLRNTVVARDARTVALGGLYSTQQMREEHKVPLLGDLPVLGWLFRVSHETQRKTNLMVFITPHIIKDPAQLEAVSATGLPSLAAGDIPQPLLPISGGAHD